MALSSIASAAFRRSLHASKNSKLFASAASRMTVKTTTVGTSANNNHLQYFSTKQSSTMDDMETGTKMYMSLYVSARLKEEE